MPDQDTVSDDGLLKTMSAVSDLISQSWLDARMAGMRDGVEAAAVLLDGAIEVAKDTTPVFVPFLQSIADKVRMIAHEIPDNAGPDTDGEADR